MNEGKILSRLLAVSLAGSAVTSYLVFYATNKLLLLWFVAVFFMAFGAFYAFMPPEIMDMLHYKYGSGTGPRGREAAAGLAFATGCVALIVACAATFFSLPA